MRIRISYETTYGYSPAVRGAIANLRLTPRSFESQYVLRWRVHVDLDCALKVGQDSLGNIVHSFSCQRPIERFTASAVGEVETNDAIGVVRGGEETLPPEMFLRESANASPTPKLRDFVGDAIGEASDTLERLHLLMGALNKEIAHDGEADGGAGEALALKSGSAVDLTHLFIAAARSLEIPARFVTGFVAPEELGAPGALDVWAEALAPGLGWVAFDPLRDLCPNDRYVRLATGFDYASAQPIRASHSGVGAQDVSTRIQIQLSGGQGQFQRMG